MNKKGFEFSFGWIFAIIVGTVIIFLAIYAASRFAYTERKIQDSSLAQELGTILNPLSTGIEEGKSAAITLPSETRINNICGSAGNFGEQRISLSTKSGIGKEWQTPGSPTTMYDKYIFSEKMIEGKKFIVFSKPFEIPFKVGDLTFIWAEESAYCFVNPSNDIEDELNELFIERNVSKIEIKNNIKECKKEAKKVCFVSSGCDIDVSLVSNSLKKNGKTVYFEGNLIYGAIFSDPEIYECQVKRLMKRTSELSLVYLEKSKYISPRFNGCSSNIQGLLVNYANQTLIKSSQEIRGISMLAEEIGRVNDGIVSCKIF